MSSIIRVRRGDMVVSFRRCSDGLLHVRRFERITLLPTQAARPTSSAQPFRPTAGKASHFGNSETRWVDNLLYLYTRPFEIVVDPFAGGGSTIDLCQHRYRRYWVADREP